MRCTECSMPLSPQHTSCPRCGAPVMKNPTQRMRPARLVPPLHAPSPSFPQENSPAIQPDPGEQTASNAPFKQATSVPHTHLKDNTPEHAMPSRIKLGFTVAGVCFATGTLLLILVAVMAQSLSSSTLTAQVPYPTKQSTTSHPSIAATMPTTKTTPTSVLPTPTPTPSTTIYIDNVHLANTVDTATGTPLTETGTFHVGQPVYITITLHQPAYNGAVCLNWSINNNMIPYSASIGNTSLPQTNAYFFFKPGSSGQGQVNVYWASTTACIDKVPVQQETFTVTP